jgi:DNA-binding MarR family transcriptional regulator
MNEPRKKASRKKASPLTDVAANFDDASEEGMPGKMKINMAYLEGTIGYAIRRAQIAVFDDLYKTIGELSITPTQFSILSLIADNPGLNQADIAAALGVERPRIVPVIDSLEKRELARRITSGTDRRAREIHLTKEGKALLKELKKRFAIHQLRMAKRLNSDPQTFLNELWNLATKINA